MTTPRKSCRALACPRHVNREVLFCNVHWNILPLKFQRPISNNREPTVAATTTTTRGIVGAVANAVDYIARKEGRRKELKDAQSVRVTVSGQGGTTNTGTANTSSASGSTTAKYGSPLGGGKGMQQV